MQQQIIIIILLCATLFLGGCKLDTLNDPIIVADVEDEFYVNMRELLSARTNDLVIELTTINQLECENYLIDYTLEQFGGSIRISIDDLLKPDDCIVGYQSAYADINTGIITSGQYNLSFELKETIINRGKLNVNGDQFKMEMESEHGLIFLHKELFKIPDRLVWGYIAYEDQDFEAVASQLQTDLLNQGSDIDLKQGFYGYFSIDQSNSITVPDTPNLSNISMLYFKLEEDVSQLKAIIDNLPTGGSSAIEVKLFTWDGGVI